MMYFAADSISGNNELALMLMPSSSVSSLTFAVAGTLLRVTSIPNGLTSSSVDRSAKI